MARTDEHPTAEIGRMLTGAATPEERRAVVSHLLAGCGSCSRRLVDGLRPSARPVPSGKDLREMVARVVGRFSSLQAEVEKEEETADRLLAELEGQPHGRALTVLSSSGAIRAVPCASASSRKRWQHVETTRRGRYSIAEQALAVAERYEGPACQELRARAWMEVANSRRIAGDLEAAEHGLAERGRMARS